MKKTYYIITIFLLIFSFTSNIFANNLDNISQKLLKKQNNSIEKLKKLHKKIIDLEEKIDT
jgi:peptidoglycan hydrolase CwlO-like protein